MDVVLIQIAVLLPVFVLNGLLSIWLYLKHQKRREVKFLKQLTVRYPVGSSITFVSVQTSDKKALEDIMDQWAIHLAKNAPCSTR